MTRSEILRDLLDNGRGFSTARLEELAADLGLPVADVLLVAGHAVPGHLLPPDRDAQVMRAFVYRVTYCGHPQLAALREFVCTLPAGGQAPGPWAARAPGVADPFPTILHGLMRSRGLRLSQFPFVGLSRSTIRGMLRGGWHRLSQLQAVAGPLGWTLQDLAVLAVEPLQSLSYRPMLCRHFGAVMVAAVPCTTEQLIHAAQEADRLSAREDQGMWQPVAERMDDCPDADAVGR